MKKLPQNSRDPFSAPQKSQLFNISLGARELLPGVQGWKALQERGQHCVWLV